MRIIGGSCDGVLGKFSIQSSPVMQTLKSQNPKSLNSITSISNNAIYNLPFIVQSGSRGQTSSDKKTEKGTKIISIFIKGETPKFNNGGIRLPILFKEEKDDKSYNKKGNGKDKEEVPERRKGISLTIVSKMNKVKKVKVGAGPVTWPKEVEGEKSESRLEIEKAVKEIERLGRAVPVLNRERSKGLTAGVIMELKKKRLWKSVVEVMEWLRKDDWWTWDLYNYSILVSAYAKLGKVSEAQNTFNRIIAAGLEPNKVAFTALIEAHTKQNLFSEAEALLRRMETSGPSPSRVTYQTLLQAYSQAKMFSEMEALFSKLCASESEDLLPDSQMYNTIICAYARDGRSDDATRLYRRMKGGACKPTLVTFNTLIDMYSRQSRSREAESFFRQMQEAGLQPDVITYTSLLTAYGRQGRAEEAQQIFRDMICCNLRPTSVAYGALVDAYGKAGETEKAQFVFDEMISKKLYPQVQTYTALIDSYCREGAMEEAESLFRRMRSQRIKPTEATYSVLINGYREICDVSGALAKFSEMDAAGIPPAVPHYSLMIRLYAETEDFDNAYLMFKEMVDSGLEADTGARRALLEACNDEDDKNEVMLLIGELSGGKESRTAKVVFEFEDEMKVPEGLAV